MNLRYHKILVCVIIVLLSCSGDELRSQNLLDITRPPADSTDAENLRIWYSIERVSRCLMTIKVTDLAHRTVRTLLERPLGKGYYNFYWDKKDDSGRFVPAGRYLYIVDDCGKIKYGNLTVNYKPWENTSIIVPDTLGDSISFRLELLEDSARVTLEVFEGYKTFLANPMTDSLMNRGKYVYIWKPDKNVRPGLYSFKWTVGDYVREFKVTFKK